jgi:hypothetical protein
MKIFLMYYDRYKNATTSKMLNREHIVLCHDNKERFECIGEYGQLLQTNEPKGIQNNFNYGLSLLDEGEWGIFLSDDLIGGKKLVGDKFVDCKVDYVLNELIRILPKCDTIGVKLVGLNSTGNPFYAKNKYSKYGLVDGRCFAIKKTNFRYHKTINTIPDYYATAYHLKQYGGNLILNQCFLDFKRYEEGGLGTIDERIEDKKRDVRLMVKLFPDNVKVKDKLNQPKGSHIIIKR